MKQLLPLLLCQLFTVIHSQCLQVIIPELLQVKTYLCPRKDRNVKPAKSTCPQGSMQCHRPSDQAQDLCQPHQYQAHKESSCTPENISSHPQLSQFEYLVFPKSPKHHIMSNTSGTSEKSLKFSVFFSLKGVMSIFATVCIYLENILTF